MIRLATFNLNNLFSRWNFKGQVKDYQKDTYPTLSKEGRYWVRKFKGKLINEKNATETERLAERIKTIKPDILAVQEVEDKNVLNDFNRDYLKNYFKYCILIEGNDDRFIDVGLMSKYPIGEVRSYQKWVNPNLPKEPIFRRDLLQVEILNNKRERLFWVFVTHLKSKLVIPSKDQTPAQVANEIKKASYTRQLECESICEIISNTITPKDVYFLCGDFNDTRDSEALYPIFKDNKGCLGLKNLIEKYVQKEDERWTTTFKETGKERTFDQIDFILVNSKNEKLVKDMKILRRVTTISKKDGSDHDPVYCDIGI